MTYEYIITLFFTFVVLMIFAAIILVVMEKRKINEKLFYYKVFCEMISLQEMYYEFLRSGKLEKFVHINQYLEQNDNLIYTIINNQDYLFKTVKFIKISKNDKFLKSLLNEIAECKDKDILSLVVKRINIINELVRLKTPFRYMINILKKILCVRFLEFTIKLLKFLSAIGRKQKKYLSRVEIILRSDEEVRPYVNLK